MVDRGGLRVGGGAGVNFFWRGGKDKGKGRCKKGVLCLSLRGGSSSGCIIGGGRGEVGKGAEVVDGIADGLHHGHSEGRSRWGGGRGESDGHYANVGRLPTSLRVKDGGGEDEDVRAELGFRRRQE